MRDRLVEPAVGPRSGERGGIPEVVERTQHVVPPAARVEQLEEVVGRLAGAAPEQRPLEQELLAAGARLAGCRRATGRALELRQPLEDVDRRRERRPHRALRTLAVPAAVVEPLTDQAIDEGRDVHPEVGAVGDGPPVDALLDLAGPERLVRVLPAGVGPDQPDHPPGRGRAGVQAELAKLVDREAGRRPGLAHLHPLTVVEAAGDERAAVPLAVPSSRASSRAPQPSVSTRARCADHSAWGRRAGRA